MARRPDVQYIQFYTDGSAARQVEPKAPVRPKKPRVKASRPRKQPVMVVHVDPVAVAGIVVAAVMLVLLVMGMVTLADSYAEQSRMRDYVATLEAENRNLRDTYTAGYDLDAVRELAEALGMVPADQVTRIPITVTMPRIQVEPTLWEQIQDFFAELFA